MHGVQKKEVRFNMLNQVGEAMQRRQRHVDPPQPQPPGAVASGLSHFT